MFLGSILENIRIVSVSMLEMILRMVLLKRCVVRLLMIIELSVFVMVLSVRIVEMVLLRLSLSFFNIML